MNREAAISEAVEDSPLPGVRLALCHEWLDHRHGSEKTFEEIAQAFPEADLYALTWNRKAGLSFGGRSISTTFLDHLGPLKTHHALLLPLMPLAWRYASRREYDVVITSSHACAKGFWPARKALHLCYCYTPMRYVWLSSIDRRHAGRAVTAPAVSAFKSWDLASAGWVDEFAAISTVVQERIKQIYSRPSRVIHPPVATDFYTPVAGKPEEGFALSVSRLVPYKRLDLAIQACHALGYPLVIAGSGPQEPFLRSLAARLGARVEFVISANDETLRKLYRTARVSIFPAEEDFGIVAVEAQACGTPVVALGRGGSLDTIVDGQTGVLVAEQDEEHFVAGLESVLNGKFSPSDCRHNAERFSTSRFIKEFQAWVHDAQK